MSKLRELYEWIDEFNGKQLTAPPGGMRFIEIAFDGEVSALSALHFISLFFILVSQPILY